MSENKIIVSKDKIVDLYTDYLLSKGERPNSVYSFAKENEFEESVFYSFFGSFEALENEVFNMLFKSTMATLATSDEYQTYSAKDKLLAFYYTFFENLTANRSLVKMLLQNGKLSSNNLKLLQGLRSLFKEYISTLEVNSLNLKDEKLTKFQNQAMEEGAWGQLLLTIKFWLDDDSAGFEKTDIFIEKSVNTSFELINTQPVKSLIDLGKFVFQERAGFFQKNK